MLGRHVNIMRCEDRLGRKYGENHDFLALCHSVTKDLYLIHSLHHVWTKGAESDRGLLSSWRPLSSKERDAAPLLAAQRGCLALPESRPEGMCAEA